MGALNLSETHCILGWVTGKLTWRGRPAGLLLPEGRKTIAWMIVGHLGWVGRGAGQWEGRGGYKRFSSVAGRENELGWRGWEESNVFAFHYKNHKTVLMTKYWALWNKILDHITSIMVSHFGTGTLLQTKCVVPHEHLHYSHFVCVCVCEKMSCRELSCFKSIKGVFNGDRYRERERER